MSTEHDRHLEDSLPHDELDALLRIWHEENAERGRGGRALGGHAQVAARLSSGSMGGGLEKSSPVLARLAGATRSGSLRAAASFAMLIAAIALLIPLNSQPAMARQEVILVPDGGKLEARDARGQLIGPCALKHTDVHADIAGPFSRVTVKQQYHNPYPNKIEAVYTFPLSHRAAVDRMTMTIRGEGGDRVIEGEVKEREQARQMYESARSAGHVASLLEQERPNIFTQSVANIEPNAQVLIEISYVEVLQQTDGELTFDFPMVVAPRYIPGFPIASFGNHQGLNEAGARNLPNELERRDGGGGLILLGPATFERQKIALQGAVEQGNLQMQQTPIGPAPFIQRFIDAATPILAPDGTYRQREDVQAWYRANPNYDFQALYADGSREFGQIAGDGLGHINGRWFYFDPAMFAVMQREEASDAAAFAQDTSQVPDASRITPMPMRPPTRSGHDISLSVRIDTGEGAGGAGPAIIEYKSDLHEIVRTDGPQYGNPGNRINLALKDQHEIPNRDFVLRWRCVDDSIREAVFTHADAKWVDNGGPGVSPGRVANGDGRSTPNPTPMDSASRTGETPVPPSVRGGGFLTAVIAPPAKVAPEQILPRELVFVLDTSGSMSGFPIEKAKAVMAKAIDAMRSGDTFNMITFAGDTRILWKSPRANTEANRNEAQAFLAAQSGNGGTEMMTAINAALTPTADVDSAKPQALTGVQLADLPADGREVVVHARFDDIEAIVMKSAVMQPMLRVRDNLKLRISAFHFPVEQMHANPLIELRGKWSTVNGERVLEIAEGGASRIDESKHAPEPLRIVMFLTDGQVGNDEAIIAAVRANAKTTRVFSFGIGDSPNRYLLDGIAQAGRGEAAYVNLNNDPDAAVQAFARRIESPVLRDIEITFSEGLAVFDVLPALDAPGGIPDLWDLKPLIVHGRYSIGDVGAAKPRSGKITIKGKTAQGEYVRVIDVTLPEHDEHHAMLPALWARAKIDDVLARDDNVRRQGIVANATDVSKSQVIALGERYGITSAFTSFVAVEKARVTIAGESMLVPIPVELPSGMDWDHVVGDDARIKQQAVAHVRRVGVDVALRQARQLQMELRYGDALMLTDAILAVEPMNPSAMTMRDLIETAVLYREYLEHVKVKNLGYGQLSIDNEQAMVIPRRNFSGPGESALSEFYNADGTLKEPRIVGSFDVGMFDEFYDFGEMRTTTSTQNQLYFGQAQQQLGAIDPMSLAQFGVEYRTAVNSVAPSAAGETPMYINGRRVLGFRQAGSADFSGSAGGGAGGGGVSDFTGSVEVPVFADELSRLGGRLPDVDGRWNSTVDLNGQNTATSAAPSQPDANKTRGLTRSDRAIVGQLSDAGGGGGSGVSQQAVDEAMRQRENDLLASAESSRKNAESSKKAAAAKENEQRQQQVDEAMKRVRTLISERKPDEALQVLDEVLFIDPQNQTATELRDDLIAAMSPGESSVTGMPPQATSKQQMQYPLDWPSLGGRSPYRSHWEANLNETRVPIEFTGNSLEQITAFFEQVSGLNLDVDWDSLAAMGVDRESQVTLRMSDVTMRTALVEVLKQLGKDQSHPAFAGDGSTVFIAAPDKIDALVAKAAAARAKTEAEQAALIAQLKREDRLQRVIDRRLWALINADDSTNKAANGPVAIVILANDPNDAAMLAQLKALGMRVDDRHLALKLVAGEIDDARKLVDVALLDGVRRIEPALVAR